ncbi:RimK family alpha-L-glutamate ligase [Fictibacillus iocasae]|uniref:RimK family alpha-L-glutamate ligase n=1 Tax=Fictibacillus iocasae TaxID=2715437 RepID=A0ABW2NPQ6_9BACL
MSENCWIVYNGSLSQKKFISYAEWMAAAASQAGIRAELVPNNEILTVFQSGRCTLTGQKSGSLPDFVLFGDKDVLLARQLERMNVPVFNSSSSIEVCDSKTLMYEQLALQGIPFPKTMSSPKLFTPDHNERHIEMYMHEFTFPMIVKEAYGSFGQQVYLVHSKNELQEKIRELDGVEYVVQEFISESNGRDIRINVIGGEPVASMIRRSVSDFRANITSGGTAENYSPTAEEKALAVAAARAVGTDFAGVDLLFTKEGPTVCEVNSNAHIESIFHCTGINVADYMLSYIKEIVYG